MNTVPRLVNSFDDEYHNSRLITLEAGWPMTHWYKYVKYERLDLGTGKWREEGEKDAHPSGYARSPWFEISLVIDGLIAFMSIILGFVFVERLHLRDWTILIEIAVMMILIALNLCRSEDGNIGFPIRYAPTEIDNPFGFLAILFVAWPINILTSITIFTLSAFVCKRLRVKISRL